MSKNIKKGFTIVELLIVIVVIGILATITVVAYQGVQNRAKTTKAVTSARDILKKADVYNADNDSYPADEAALKAATGVGALDSNLKTLIDKTPDADNKDGLEYTVCDNASGDHTGGKVTYWDYTDGQTKTVQTGTCE